MTEADEFRHYAEEAMRWVAKSTTENEKKALLGLAHTWAQAAQEADVIMVPTSTPPERHIE